MDDINLENTNLNDLNINLDELDSLDDTNIEVQSNMILDNSEDLTLGLTDEQIQEFYDYLSGKTARPIFAEKFFADGDSRIRESNQLTTLMSLSFVPKLLAMQQSLVDSLSNPETLKYLSTDEKISYLNTLSNMSSKFNELAMKYSQASKDFSSMPLIYRQLLDQLLIIPAEKLPRLKTIPSLVDLSEEKWNRIVEIANIKE
jgi:hypothetical protein